MYKVNLTLLRSSWTVWVKIVESCVGFTTEENRDISAMWGYYSLYVAKVNVARPPEAKKVTVAEMVLSKLKSEITQRLGHLMQDNISVFECGVEFKIENLISE